MNVLHVVGARPNFMKAAPVLRALAGHVGVRQTVVHSGQHYDHSMSGVFFEQLGMPEPDVNLQVGSHSHALQTALIMQHFEPVLVEKLPDFVVVYGDVNSTVSAALVCSKLGVKVAHVEAGLRSFDRSMPEEINRLITDQLSDLLFTPSADADKNLVREGISPARIHMVGNVMIDTLIRLLPAAESKAPDLIRRFGLSRFVLVTLHRPATVDDPEALFGVLKSISEAAGEYPLLFPTHPRTMAKIGNRAGKLPTNLKVIEPLPYLEFLALQKCSRLIVTDSGGIQEESTYLGVPCLTVRENTERPVTVTLGTNQLVGTNPENVGNAVHEALLGTSKRGEIPALWDGQSSERIAKILLRHAK